MWLRCDIKQKTPKAILIRIEGKEFWIPKSLVYNEKSEHLDIVDWKYDQLLADLGDEVIGDGR